MKSLGFLKAISQFWKGPISSGNVFIIIFSWKEKHQEKKLFQWPNIIGKCIFIFMFPLIIYNKCQSYIFIHWSHKIEKQAETVKLFVEKLSWPSSTVKRTYWSCNPFNTYLNLSGHSAFFPKLSITCTFDKTKWPKPLSRKDETDCAAHVNRKIKIKYFFPPHILALPGSRAITDSITSHISEG